MTITKAQYGALLQLRRAALAASPAPEPTPGLRTALDRFLSADTAFEDWGERADANFAETGERADDERGHALWHERVLAKAALHEAAALAASPSPEPTGLRAALEVWLFPEGLDHPETWSLTNEGARFIAAAANRAAPEPTGLDAFREAVNDLPHWKYAGRAALVDRADILALAARLTGEGS